MGQLKHLRSFEAASIAFAELAEIEAKIAELDQKIEHAHEAAAEIDSIHADVFEKNRMELAQRRKTLEVKQNSIRTAIESLLAEEQEGNSSQRSRMSDAAIEVGRASVNARGFSRFLRVAGKIQVFLSLLIGGLAIAATTVQGYPHCMEVVLISSVGMFASIFVGILWIGSSSVLDVILEIHGKICNTNE